MDGPKGTSFGLDRVPIPADSGHEREVIRHLVTREAGTIHLVGAGGVGMAGLGRLLQERGLKVTGCDREAGPLTDWLNKQGIACSAGHDPGHITDDVGVVIRSTAIHNDHPEIRQASACGLPILHRGKVLGSLLPSSRSVAVTGTHGKTSTTAMIVHVLKTCGLDPSYFIGGEHPFFDGVAGGGQGDWTVVEADESDGTLVYYHPAMAVITNIEYDHMEHFDREADFFGVFERFAVQTGCMIYNRDDEQAHRICRELRNSIPFGLHPASRLHAEEVERFCTHSRCVLSYGERRLGRLDVGVPGLHNVSNALAAVTVALELGCTFEAVAGALASYRSVSRRFERVGQLHGAPVISDYAHHPTEVAAAVQTARSQCKGRILVVFQPHRYTRTFALGAQFPHAFREADEVWLLPVYAASEAPIDGGRSEDLAARFIEGEHPAVHLADSAEEAWEAMGGCAHTDDLVLILAAADIGAMAGLAERG